MLAVQASLEMSTDGSHQYEKAKKNAFLFSAQSVPTRDSISSQITEKNLLSLAADPCAKLFGLVESDFTPLSLCQDAKPYLDQIASDEICEGKLKDYVIPLKQIIFFRLIKQLSEVYVSMTIEDFENAASIVPFNIAETWMANASRQQGISIQINYMQKAIIFGAPTKVDMKSMRQPLIEIGFKLQQAMQCVAQEELQRKDKLEKQQLLTNIKERMEQETRSIRQRKEEIERRKEESERRKQIQEREAMERQRKEEALEAEKERKRQEEERKRREAEKQEQRKRELELQKNLEVLEQMKKQAEQKATNLKVAGKKISEIEADDLSNISFDQIEKAREAQVLKERQDKIRQRKAESKRVDHLARALREEEAASLKQWAADVEKVDAEQLEKFESAKQEEQRKQHQNLLKEKEELLPFQHVRDNWAEQQLEPRRLDWEEERGAQIHRLTKKVVQNKIARAMQRRDAHVKEQNDAREKEKRRQQEEERRRQREIEEQEEAERREKSYFCSREIQSAFVLQPWIMRPRRLLLQLLLVDVFLCKPVPKVYFHEKFLNESWESRWVHSEQTGVASFEWSAGQWFANESEQRGLRTAAALQHHAISAKLSENFSNRGRDLVLQFTVKHENEDLSFCGGGYIKLMGSDLHQKSFGPDSPYKIMFGPDICGFETSVVHLVLNWKGKNLRRSPEISLGYDDRDSFTHIFTFHLKPDNTYSVFIDMKEKSSGELHAFWPFPNKTIDDPTDRKPEDWVETRRIVDPDVQKPESWVDEQRVPDSTAWKPLEWDDEEDGLFEPPFIDNPLYQGPWFPAMVDNPSFRGHWRPRQRGNPEYEEEVYSYTDLGAVGFDLWTVHEGSVFDNILLCDSLDFAKSEATRLQELFSKEKEARRKWKQLAGDQEVPANDAELPEAGVSVNTEWNIVNVRRDLEPLSSWENKLVNDALRDPQPAAFTNLLHRSETVTGGATKTFVSSFADRTIGVETVRKLKCSACQERQKREREEKRAAEEARRKEDEERRERAEEKRREREREIEEREAKEREAAAANRRAAGGGGAAAGGILDYSREG
ncbi:Calreticulin [Symbiodinium microadriaticum]|uniref:Calreticulin n=1 Tax=Symbiodinium microadriaticum TaxID=2951 RepID=A0A1Q9DL24_SYMMI|nr:Calreticulin [Symbiodinium microadriaticum]